MEVSTIVRFNEDMTKTYRGLAETITAYPSFANELLAKLLEYEIYTGILSDILDEDSVDMATFAETTDAIYQTKLRHGENPMYLEEFFYHVGLQNAMWLCFASIIADEIVQLLNKQFSVKYLGVEVNVISITPMGTHVRLRFEA